MSALVVDASIIATWLFKDEQTPQTDHLLDRVKTEGATAPVLWRYEAANILLTARRKDRAPGDKLDAMASLLAALPIEDDPISHRLTFSSVHELGAAHGLTAYDAAYLELASRRKLPLATLDQQLRRAATAVGVHLLP